MINKIILQNFRSYSKQEFEFGHKTIIVGENGSGKSNLLEALYMMAIGKSKRAGTESEMIKYGEQVTVVKATITKSQDTNKIQDPNSNNQTELQIMLNDGSLGAGKKRFEVNGVARRMIDFVGKIRMVEFSPEDMELISGSPSIRRRYLDFVISQVDREYHRCLVSYEKGVRSRNKILENIREGLAGRQQLWFWDRLLIKDGNFITQRREEYLNSLNTPLQLPPNLGGRVRGGYKVEYDKSVISDTRLAQYEMEEVAAATTLVGPHRDDFIVTQAPSSKFQETNKSQIQNSNDQNYKDVAKYGSRGEQRMAVLWLKQFEIKHLSSFARASEDAQQPTLLLDDIFSELDEKHKKEVLKLIDDQIDRGGQVIMTTADKNVVPKTGDWKVIKI